MAAARMEYPYDVTIVSPNAALDSYYAIDALRFGEINRAREVFHTAGGKGNNMARALVMLGGRALSIGILGGKSGEFISRELEREDIASEIIWTQGETRRTVTIPITTLQQSTGILEGGAAVGASVLQAFTDAVFAHALDAPFLTLIGSLPSDFPPNFYAELIGRLRAMSVRVALDTSGAVLRHAAFAAPHILKINLEEFNAIFAEASAGTTPNWQVIQQVADDLQAHGLDTLIITQGAHGAYVFSRAEVPFRVFTPLERWVCPAGSGDSFMAALLLGLVRGEPLRRAACFASAAATANIEHMVSGYITEEALARLLPKTVLEPLALEGST
jgi:1-phosphofructokinase family hexose kinase